MFDDCGDDCGYPDDLDSALRSACERCEFFGRCRSSGGTKEECNFKYCDECNLCEHHFDCARSYSDECPIGRY